MEVASLLHQESTNAQCEEEHQPGKHKHIKTAYSVRIHKRHNDVLCVMSDIN